jgi:hypothetical protein
MFDIGSLVSSVAGIGVSLGTAIPGLKKPKKQETAKAAARAGSKLAGNVVGAAQAGHGAGRGLAIRSGLRAASDGMAGVAGKVAGAAQADEAANRAAMEARNERLASFGAGAAEGLGQVAQSIIGPKGADAPGTAAVRLGKGNEDEKQELAREAMDGTQEKTNIEDQETLDLQADVQKQMDTADQAAAGDPSAVGPTAQFESTQALEELRAISPTVAAPKIEADLGNRLQAKNLMRQDAERMGYNFDTLLANVNRRLNLRPGQSQDNPMGLDLGMDDGDE